MALRSIANTERSKMNYIEVRLQSPKCEMSAKMWTAGMLHGRMPLVTTDPNKLEEQAKGVLTPKAYN